MASALQGLEDLLARLEKLKALNNVRSALLLGGGDLKTHLAKYPPAKRVTRKSIYGKSFQSERQRRWFFWALKQGTLRVPYRRTRQLGNRWAVKAYNNGLTVEVGNITPYGPGVQGVPQWRMMKAIGWQTTEDVLSARGPTVVQYIRDGIERDAGNA